MTIDKNPQSAHADHGQLQTICDTTRLMLEMATQNSWEELTRLERQRRHHLDGYFARVISKQEVTWVAQVLEQIMAMDKEIALLALKYQEELALQFTTFRNGQRANQAYKIASL